MSLVDQFNASVKEAEQLTRRPSNEELLSLYALYKQATLGDVQGEAPGGFDFKGIAKYNAWSALKGTSREQAMQQYVDLVKSLSEKYR